MSICTEYLSLVHDVLVPFMFFLMADLSWFSTMLQIDFAGVGGVFSKPCILPFLDF